MEARRRRRIQAERGWRSQKSRRGFREAVGRLHRGRCACVRWTSSLGRARAAPAHRRVTQRVSRGAARRSWRGVVASGETRRAGGRLDDSAAVPPVGEGGEGRSGDVPALEIFSRRLGSRETWTRSAGSTAGISVVVRRAAARGVPGRTDGAGWPCGWGSGWRLDDEMSRCGDRGSVVVFWDVRVGLSTRAR
ncbi:vegetative cell wall protein gp1-like [Iris pallida]|uniref:Vegetative cell wall protein gp1-like n=1 Tax=Iris pallida TaxID=29817 RepID=A0AAX6F0F6_IRIPA|nr:vegetative cell wall protein gp1-like [Iris pallida]